MASHRDSDDHIYIFHLSEESQAGFDRLSDLLGKHRLSLPRRNRSRPKDIPATR